ncbi:MAG: helix-turn-helix domain-containing protein [Lachnospiraceae bacterium]
MKVSYNKLWKLLIDRKLSSADLRKAVEIAPNTMTKMRKDEEVSMSVLLKIASYLDCDISDICEFVKEDQRKDELNG